MSLALYTEKMIDLTSATELFSWDEYLAFARHLFDNEGKTTSDIEDFNTPEIINYTKINFARIKRIDKQLAFIPKALDLLPLIPIQWQWYMLVESWCGDVAQVGPVIAEFAEKTGTVDLKLMLRDKNLPIMDQVLTNGGRSIPKLICVNRETGEFIGSWGPRPQILQKLIDTWAEEKLGLMVKAERIHKWYADDHTIHTQLELVSVFKDWIEKTN